jgi:hypothetical protein
MITASILSGIGSFALGCVILALCLASLSILANIGFMLIGLVIWLIASVCQGAAALVKWIGGPANE